MNTSAFSLGKCCACRQDATILGVFCVQHASVVTFAPSAHFSVPEGTMCSICEVRRGHTPAPFCSVCWQIDVANAQLEVTITPPGRSTSALPASVRGGSGSAPRAPPRTPFAPALLHPPPPPGLGVPTPPPPPPRSSSSSSSGGGGGGRSTTAASTPSMKRHSRMKRPSRKSARSDDNLYSVRLMLGFGHSQAKFPRQGSMIVRLNLPPDDGAEAVAFTQDMLIEPIKAEYVLQFGPWPTQLGLLEGVSAGKTAVPHTGVRLLAALREQRSSTLVLHFSSAASRAASSSSHHHSDSDGSSDSHWDGKESSDEMSDDQLPELVSMDAASSARPAPSFSLPRPAVPTHALLQVAPRHPAQALPPAPAPAPAPPLTSAPPLAQPVVVVAPQPSQQPASIIGTADDDYETPDIPVDDVDAHFEDDALLDLYVFLHDVARARHLAQREKAALLGPPAARQQQLVVEEEAAAVAEAAAQTFQSSVLEHPNLAGLLGQFAQLYANEGGLSFFNLVDSSGDASEATGNGPAFSGLKNMVDATLARCSCWSHVRAILEAATSSLFTARPLRGPKLVQTLAHLQALGNVSTPSVLRSIAMCGALLRVVAIEIAPQWTDLTSGDVDRSRLRDVQPLCAPYRFSPECYTVLFCGAFAPGLLGLRKTAVLSALCSSIHLWSSAYDPASCWLYDALAAAHLEPPTSPQLSLLKHEDVELVDRFSVSDVLLIFLNAFAGGDLFSWAASDTITPQLRAVMNERVRNHVELYTAVEERLVARRVQPPSLQLLRDVAQVFCEGRDDDYVSCVSWSQLATSLLPQGHHHALFIAVRTWAHALSATDWRRLHTVLAGVASRRVTKVPYIRFHADTQCGGFVVHACNCQLTFSPFLGADQLLAYLNECCAGTEGRTFNASV